MPGIFHGAIINFTRAGIACEKGGRDVVGFASVGKCEQRTRAWDHAVTLILTVGSVTDFFGERIVGVLECTHHGRVDSDVQSFKTIEIACRIEKAVEGFRVGTISGGKA